MKTKDTIMANPVGYYSLSHEKELIKELCKIWGESLEKMTEGDRLWLISEIAKQAWVEKKFDEPCENAKLTSRFLYELEYWEKIALIKAIIQ